MYLSLWFQILPVTMDVNTNLAGAFGIVKNTRISMIIQLEHNISRLTKHSQDTPLSGEVSISKLECICHDGSKF